MFTIHADVIDAYYAIYTNDWLTRKGHVIGLLPVPSMEIINNDLQQFSIEPTIELELNIGKGAL